MDKEQCMELSPGLEEKRENGAQGIFPPFHHTPDPEYIRLELERSALNQDQTKLINDRFKLITEISAMRKEKEQKEKLKFAQMSQNLDFEKFMEAANQFDDLSVEDINKATHLFQNMILTSVSLTEDGPKNLTNRSLEKMYCHGNSNRFINSNYGEIITKADVSNFDMIKSVSGDHEFRVEDDVINMREELEDGEGEISFSHTSQEQDGTKCSQIIFGCKNEEFIAVSFDELLEE